MLAVAGGILLAILVLFFLPDILAIIAMLMVIAVGIIVLVGFFSGAIPIDIVFYGIGLWIVISIFKFLGGKGNPSNVNEHKSYMYSAGKKISGHKSAPSWELPFSQKLKFKKALRSLYPNFTHRSALKKIKDLKDIDDRQSQYCNQALQNASDSLDHNALELIGDISEYFQQYINSDLLEIRGNRTGESSSTSTFRYEIQIYFDGRDNEIARIVILERAVSLKKSIKTLSLFLPQSGKNEMYNLRFTKIIKELNKEIINQIKKKPQIIDRLQVE